MHLLDSLGIPQFHLPPLMRPNWPWLESLGFTGDRADALKRCFDLSPTLLSAATSSAFMWTANAATVAPSCDTHDQRLQLVPANLCCNLHRGQETMDRRDQLRALFAAVPDAIVHEPLPSVFPLRDEGAANHIRVCDREGLNAVHLFVYGPPSENSGSGFMGRQFMGRQSALPWAIPVRPLGAADELPISSSFPRRREPSIAASDASIIRSSFPRRREPSHHSHSTGFPPARERLVHWIPACAGTTGALDSRLRGNDLAWLIAGAPVAPPIYACRPI